jgi:hypothetical protein
VSGGNQGCGSVFDCLFDERKTACSSEINAQSKKKIVINKKKKRRK